MRRVILIALFLLLPLISAMAIGTSEATSEESWVIAHSSVNNDNKYWDVAQTLIPGTPVSEFAAASDNGLLRIRTNYGKEYKDDNHRKVEISPVGSWDLVCDGNVTLKRRYSIDIYEIEWTRNGYKGTPSQVGSTKIITPDDTNDDTISFTMKAATWDTDWEWEGWKLVIINYAKTFHDYEIVIRLPALTENELAALEPGSYHASFNVSLYLGSDGGEVLTETYSIKAEFGKTSGENTEYAFMVDSGESTYSVDLTATKSYFEVANLMFHAANTSSSNNDKTTVENAFKGKYKVLIAPYANYRLDTNPTNPYIFVLNGTENATGSEINRVPFKIYKDSSGGTFSIYNNSYPHTYVMTPTLNVSGTERNWVLNWSLEQPIYVKPEAPSNETISRAAGFYKTTLYFFVVTN